jgi:hypothetical protein
VLAILLSFTLAACSPVLYYLRVFGTDVNRG